MILSVQNLVFNIVFNRYSQSSTKLVQLRFTDENPPSIDFTVEIERNWVLNCNFTRNIHSSCMKRSQIILFAVAILLFGAMYTKVAMNKKTYKKEIKEEAQVVFVPVREVKNTPHDVTLSAYGQVSPVTELAVSFEVQGKLLQGRKRLKPGVKFSKGEILYSIDQEEMIYAIAAQKMTFKSVVAQSLPDIVLDFPSEQQKWKDFLDNIQVGLVMPELPQFSSKKERLFWTTRNMLTQYYNIISQEKRMAKYTYIAPFSGTVVEVYAEPGSIINPGVQVAKIARTGEFEIKVPVSIQDVENCKKQATATFTDSEGNEIATGKIIRISDVVNQRTQSVDVYYSVKPVNGSLIYNGLYMNVDINVKTEQHTMSLPRTALNGKSVYVLKGTQLIPAEVHVAARQGDSIYVTQLTNGQKVVTDQVGSPSKDITYKELKPRK